MGKQGRADDVALAVHGVDAEYDRYRLGPTAGIHRRLPVRVRKLEPGLRRGVVGAAGVGAAAGQDRSQPILAYIVRSDASDVALDDLADLFLDAHRCKQRVDTLFQLGILGEGPLNRGPGFRSDRARSRRFAPGAGIARRAAVDAAGGQCDQQCQRDRAAGDPGGGARGRWSCRAHCDRSPSGGQVGANMMTALSDQRTIRRRNVECLLQGVIDNPGHGTSRHDCRCPVHDAAVFPIGACLALPCAHDASG